MDSIVELFSVGGPAVGGAFIATIILRMFSERQRSKMKKMRVTADSDSIAVQAANEVISLVRDELDATRTRQRRMMADNERLSRENEELNRKLHQLSMKYATSITINAVNSTSSVGNSPVYDGLAQNHEQPSLQEKE